MVKRLVVVHWNKEEAKDRVARLRKAGYRVGVYSRQGGEGLREFRNRPPDAFVIDLSRLPSHGRAVATFLRQQKGTRHVPIAFVGGAASKVARVRHELPDAVYTQWPRIRSAIRQALKNAPEHPHVPGTMDAYSSTPLPKKLGIKPEMVVALLGAPKNFPRALGDARKSITLRTQARGKSDVVLLFAKSVADLNRRFAGAKRAMADGGKLWIAWPKQASGVASDLTQQHVREIGLANGLVDYKICAIDATWSGLRFTRRKEK